MSLVSWLRGVSVYFLVCLIYATDLAMFWGYVRGLQAWLKILIFVVGSPFRRVLARGQSLTRLADLIVSSCR